MSPLSNRIIFWTAFLQLNPSKLTKRDNSIRYLRSVQRLDPVVITVALCTAVIHCIVALSHGGPVAVPDVSAYLSFAQWAHGGVLPEQLHFYPGYGFLLSPFGWLDGASLHTSALLMNALAAGACVVLTAMLCTQLGLSQRTVRIAALVAVIHPSISASSRIAWPETLLILMVLTLALLVQQDRWLVAGITTGLALSLHPRMLVVAITIGALALYGGRLRRLTLGLAPSAVMVACLLSWTGTWPAERIAAVQNGSSGFSFVSTLAGQWLALAGGTAALATIGLIAGLLRFRNGVVDAEVFIAASALAMIVLGAWSLTGSDRFDTLLYGRYVAPWTVPLILVGIAAISRREINSRVVFGAALSLLAALAIGLIASSQMSTPARRIMTLDLGAVWVTLNGRYLAVAVAAAAIGVAGVLTVIRGPSLALALLCCLAVAGSVLNHVHLRNVGVVSEGQSTTTRFVSEETTCLSHDASTRQYAMWLYRLQLPDVRHTRVDLGAGERPCGGYVIADAESLVTCVDAEFLAKEPRASWGLWKYPDQGCP